MPAFGMSQRRTSGGWPVRAVLPTERRNKASADAMRARVLPTGGGSPHPEALAAERVSYMAALGDGSYLDLLPKPE